MCIRDSIYVDESLTYNPASNYFGMNNANPQYTLDVNGSINTSSTLYASNVNASYVSGTLTTASQPYITSVGTLTSLDVSSVIVASTPSNDDNSSNVATTSYVQSAIASFSGGGISVSSNMYNLTSIGSVSYTHLTLPTIYSV